MNFLDRTPIDWDRPEVSQLRDLFVAAYRRRATAEELADSAGLALGTFPDYPNMRTTWWELIKEMAKQGILRAAVEKACQDPTVATYHDRFQEMLEGQPEVSAAQIGVNDDWWQGAKGKAAERRLHLERLMEKRSRLIDVDIARQVVNASRSVAKLTLRFANEKASGTGFLIQPNLVLTNHHNVSHKEYGDVKEITAEFDYQTNSPDTPLVLRGKGDSIISNSEHDWAVVELEENVHRELIALGTKFTVGVNDPVIIIQHPLGGFKQFTIDPMSIQHVDQEVVQYLADTQDGSSGSPVFNIKMQLIALHHAEAQRDIDIDGRVETIWRNEGIHIDRVIEDLRAKDIQFTRN